MKNLRQIKDLLKNIAKEKNINSQILLKNYMIHRLLKRIYLSKFNKIFIIKGGVLITGIIGVQSRTTIDLDTTIKSFNINENSLKLIFEKIFSINIDDVKFNINYIEKTRFEDKYDGYRIAIIASLEQAKIPIKVDITTGDKITPHEIKFPFKLLLEDNIIKINAYNIETLISEKLETVISRSVVNTRMKDFYDIHMLLKTKNIIINYTLLKRALKETSKHRGSYNLLKDGKTIISDIFNDKDMKTHWTRYKNNYSYASDIEWKQIENSINNLWDNLNI
jgi:predicted nucleotidyltransferase component of viral defense system